MQWSFFVLKRKDEHMKKILKQVGKGIVKPIPENLPGKTYQIGFVNSNGTEDETEFDNVHGLRELDKLYTTFCKENAFALNTVLYVEAA